MTRRGRIYAALLAAMALVAVVALRTEVRLGGSDAAESSTAVAERARAANQSATARPTLQVDPQRLEQAREPSHVMVDIARVEAALARVQATTAKFTQEQLADEQRKMLEAKARFEAIKIAEPKIRKFTDQTGIHWLELQHESGEIRYQLDPAAPAPGSDSTR
jgi:hypothetical protein